MATAEQLAIEIGTAPACEALGVCRATVYRRRRPRLVHPRRRPPSHRGLAQEEQRQVLEVLHSPGFADKSPAQTYATLLDTETYLCSIRTMYRLLAANGEVRERRDQLRHPQYQKPELLAVGPNQVWSWDITKLLGPVKWTYFYLYVILDIFSRYVVGWLIAHGESGVLAKRLIAATCDKQGIEAGRLVVHADRGSSMKSKPVALLLADLGVTKSHSRPHVSNDNPYSEAQFKTLKYCPEFPRRFGSIQDARAFCQRFFEYYNNEHRHSGIGLMTPAAIHYGRAEEIQGKRQAALLAAYSAHPERFAKPPKPPVLPEAAWINPPPPKTTREDDPGSTLCTPDGTRIPPQTGGQEVAH